MMSLSGSYSRHAKMESVVLHLRSVAGNVIRKLWR